MSQALDGNVAAGPLSGVFAGEITVAVTTCAGCGTVRPVGGLVAYVESPGVVLRCVSCGRVQIRLVRSRDRAWLDLGGVAVLQLELPAG